MTPATKATDDLSGKVALVTGAGRGMGRAIAVMLAGRGAEVVVNDQSPQMLEEVKQQLTGLGGKGWTVAADVTKSESVRAMVDTLIERAGSLDILINNAGTLRPTPYADISEDEWNLVVDVNLKGVFLCSQAALPQMSKRGWGRVINISSSAGKNVSTVGGVHYTAAKAGVLGVTRHLAKEVARFGVTVNAVCPGLIDTDMVRQTITDQAVEKYARGFPTPRLGRPDEVAELVAFLASHRSSYITGASFDINGGDLMI